MEKPSYAVWDGQDAFSFVEVVCLWCDVHPSDSLVILIANGKISFNSEYAHIAKFKENLVKLISSGQVLYFNKDTIAERHTFFKKYVIIPKSDKPEIPDKEDHNTLQQKGEIYAKALYDYHMEKTGQYKYEWIVDESKVNSLDFLKTTREKRFRRESLMALAKRLNEYPPFLFPENRQISGKELTDSLESRLEAAQSKIEELEVELAKTKNELKENRENLLFCMTPGNKYYARRMGICYEALSYFREKGVIPSQNKISAWISKNYVDIKDHEQGQIAYVATIQSRIEKAAGQEKK